MSAMTIILQCVGCKTKRPLDQQDEKEAAVLGCAFCRACGMPMAAVSASFRTPRRTGTVERIGNGR